MESRSEFHVKPSIINNMMALGWVAISMGVIGLLVMPMLAALIPFGIVYVILATIQRRPIVTLHDDHVEMKVAPAAARQLIRYRDLEAIGHESKDKIFMKPRGQQKIYLPARLLTETDAVELLAALQARMPAAQNA